MTKVKCPCVECKYNGKKSQCTCKEISLTWRSLATVNEGRQEVWVCKQYEEAEWAEELREKFEECMKKGELHLQSKKVGDDY